MNMSRLNKKYESIMKEIDKIHEKRKKLNRMEAMLQAKILE